MSRQKNLRLNACDGDSFGANTTAFIVPAEVSKTARVHHSFHMGLTFVGMIQVFPTRYVPSTKGWP
jgi:hypothetical protein